MLKYFERSGRKDITDVSMGCRCGHSICSVCGNEAVTEEDFCDHIKSYKGSNFQGVPVFEDNKDIEFFEISFVTTGADKQAKILEKIASKKANVSSVSKVGNQNSSLLTKIASEQNKRISPDQQTLKVKTFKDLLGDLPWT